MKVNDFRFAGLGLQPHQIEGAFRTYGFLAGKGVTTTAPEDTALTLRPHNAMCAYEGVTVKSCMQVTKPLPFFNELREVLNSKIGQD